MGIEITSSIGVCNIDSVNISNKKNRINQGCDLGSLREKIRNIFASITHFFSTCCGSSRKEVQPDKVQFNIASERILSVRTFIPNKSNSSAVQVQEESANDASLKAKNIDIDSVSPNRSSEDFFVVVPLTPQLSPAGSPERSGDDVDLFADINLVSPNNSSEERNNDYPALDGINVNTEHLRAVSPNNSSEDLFADIDPVSPNRSSEESNNDYSAFDGVGVNTEHLRAVSPNNSSEDLFAGIVVYSGLSQKR
jgi:hypothetical protein